MNRSLFRLPQKIKKTSAPLPEFYQGVMIKPHGKAKRITLRLDHKKRQFVASVPLRFSMRRVQAFIDKNHAWMHAKLNDIPRRIRYDDSAVIPVFGSDIVIKIIRNDTVKRSSVSLKNQILAVKTPLDDPAPRIQRYLKARAKTVFTDLVHEKAARIERNVEAVSIRDPSTRWGSCSASGRISLSWRLIHAPYDAMDYVIAHEVAHLEHMNHGKAFWDMCMKLSHNGEVGHAWMREHGQSLMQFG